MIPRIPDPEHSSEWQSLLANAVRSMDELLRLLDIEPGQFRVQPLAQDFPLRVPHGFIRRMARGDLNDPLLRQVLPVSAETRQIEGFSLDPLAELDAMPRPGLLHKYRGRALLTVTGACAVHCRYCFRRHFPYSEAGPAGTLLEQSLDYLDSHPDIGEIILSGGDPLSLSDRRLQSLTDRLSALPHLHTLRIHTRLPIVIPERVDSGLLNWIDTQRMKVVLVVHCNHANEIDAGVRRAMQALARHGVTLLNQSVLLHGVNDSTAALADLSKALFAAGVLPYYLHMLDPVQGAAHFAVDEQRARRLHAGMRPLLPGYLVPRLVRELPGEKCKLPLS